MLTPSFQSSGKCMQARQTAVQVVGNVGRLQQSRKQVQSLAVSCPAECSTCVCLQLLHDSLTHSELNNIAVRSTIKRSSMTLQPLCVINHCCTTATDAAGSGPLRQEQLAVHHVSPLKHISSTPEAAVADMSCGVSSQLLRATTAAVSCQ